MRMAEAAEGRPVTKENEAEGSTYQHSVGHETGATYLRQVREG